MSNMGDHMTIGPTRHSSALGLSRYKKIPCSNHELIEKVRICPWWNDCSQSCLAKCLGCQMAGSVYSTEGRFVVATQALRVKRTCIRSLVERMSDTNSQGCTAVHCQLVCRPWLYTGRAKGHTVICPVNQADTGSENCPHLGWSQPQTAH